MNSIASTGQNGDWMTKTASYRTGARGALAANRITSRHRGLAPGSLGSLPNLVPETGGADIDKYAWLSLLRAFGVVLVLAYHFFPSIMPGGFVGVDVFFVFSGYLITSLLIREYRKTGKIRLAAFYIRRFRRLLPALLGMVLVCLPMALLVSADFRVGISGQVAAMLGWVTNFHEIINGQSYDDRLLPHLFIHTCTLSIEMQYYLLWGALVFILALLFGRKLRNGTGSIPAIAAKALSLALAGAVVSLSIMWIMTASSMDPSIAYLSTASHIYPLLLGSAVGVYAGFSHSRLIGSMEGLRPLSAIAITAVALAAVVAVAFLVPFDSPAAFYVSVPLTSLSTALVILVGRGKQQSLAHYSEPKLLMYLADRSYSIYLFHWPFAIIFGQLAKTSPAAAAPALGTAVTVLFTLAALGLTFLCSHLSFRFIEQQFRAPPPAHHFPAAIWRDTPQRGVSQRSATALSQPG